MKPKPVLIAIGLFTLAVIIIPIIIYVLKFGTALDDGRDVWGQFGDFMNFFVSIANLVLVSAIIWFVYDSQKRSDHEKTKLQKEEIEKEKMMYLNTLMLKSIKFGEMFCGIIKKYADELNSIPINLPNFNPPSDVEISLLVNKVDRENYYFAYTNQVEKPPNWANV